MWQKITSIARPPARKCCALVVSVYTRLRLSIGTSKERVTHVYLYILFICNMESLDWYFVRKLLLPRKAHDLFYWKYSGLYLMGANALSSMDGWWRESVSTRMSDTFVRWAYERLSSESFISPSLAVQAFLKLVSQLISFCVRENEREKKTVFFTSKFSNYYEYCLPHSLFTFMPHRLSSRTIHSLPPSMKQAC